MLLSVAVKNRLLTFYRLKGNLLIIGEYAKAEQQPFVQNSPKSQDNYYRSRYIYLDKSSAVWQCSNVLS